MDSTAASATAFFRSFFHGFFAGFDGRFDIGPLLCDEAFAPFNRLIESGTRLFRFFDQVLLGLPGEGPQLPARVFSGLGREEDSRRRACGGSRKKRKKEGLS
jgi:hypothetical protein